jgi:hypothetical protein
MAKCHPTRPHWATDLCKQCYLTHRSRVWRQTHPDYEHQRHLKRGHIVRAQQRDRYTPYGRWLKTLREHHITLEQYIEILEAQGFKCAICGKDALEEVLSVDHDHACCPSEKSCGQCIRGLICFKCNAALGFAEDKIEVLENMIKYLRGIKVG